ncbi:hypothetical protein [uncultured Psychroserpens sp.]|uniref:hypothetical protein n=1 Tax=uncultured Psychroserpens sp. TaxID=255436 RepID=UPI0026112D03|nr:hypothetical protein [uncultured Psychroserpens sp.]
MRYLIILITILSFSNLYAQVNEQEILIKNGITKRIIQGFEYKNDSLIKQTYLVDQLDEFGNTISFREYDLNDSLVEETKYKFSDDGMTEYGEMRDKDGKLKYTIVTIKNKEKRSIRRMQISSKNDTLVEQVWIRDKNLNDSILYRVRNGKKIVSHKWNYNQGHMLTSKEQYDKNGNLFSSQSYTYEKSGNCMKKRGNRNKLVSIKCKDGNKNIWKILKDNVGYLSGIKLVLEKGGERIETKLENGLIEKIEYFSKKGKLLAQIKYTYERSN